MKGCFAKFGQLFMQSTYKNALFCQLEWCWILHFEWVKTSYIPIYCQILIPEIPSFQGLPAGVAGADVCGSHEGRAPPGCEGDFLWDFTSKTGQNWCFVQLVWPWGLGLLALSFFHIRESCFLRDFGMEKLNFTTRDGISRLKTWKLDQPKSGWNKKTWASTMANSG